MIDFWQGEGERVTKKNINRLKKAVDNCIVNAELLLWGNDTDVPTHDDIQKANELLDTAVYINDIINENSEGFRIIS